jgi:hypothetical protein
MNNDNTVNKESYEKKLSSYKLVSSDKKLEIIRTSIVDTKKLPVTIVILIVAIIYFSLRDGSTGFVIFFLLIILVIFIFLITLLPYPVRIIATAGELIIILRPFFLYLTEKQFKADDIEEIQAKPHTVKGGGQVYYYAKLNLILKSGTIWSLFKDVRPNESIANEDSEMLSNLLSEKIGLIKGHSNIQR